MTTTGGHSGTQLGQPVQEGELLVRFDGVTKTYGGVKALNGVSFSLRPGEVHALLGQNGAGKSTLIKILAGVTQMDEGTITVRGRRARFRNTGAAREAGIAVVYQELSLVPALSVAANIHLGREPRIGRGFVRQRQMAEETRAFLDLYGFPLQADTKVADLPFAHRQLTEIAKALSGNISILVLDEPTSALSEGEEKILFDAIERVTSHGVGVIYVTHRLKEVFRISRRVTVLRDGRNVGTFNTSDTDLASLVGTIVGRRSAEALREVTTAGLGPHGEASASPDELKINEADGAEVRARDLRVGVLLHTKDSDWSRGQVRGMVETLHTYGAEITHVLESGFDTERQIAALTTMVASHPDAVLSIPLNSATVGEAHRTVKRCGTQLILIDNVPRGLQHGEDYASFVSADNYGAGSLAAEMLAPYIDRDSLVGVVGYSTGFFPTDQRELGFRKWLEAHRPDVRTVRYEFADPGEAQPCAEQLLSDNAEVTSAFAVWDQPAMAVVAAARQLGRQLAITTVDLGREISLELAEGGTVKGVAAQQPYEQGAAEALAALNALIGRAVPPWVVVPAKAVTRENLSRAYGEIWHEALPSDVTEALCATLVEHQTVGTQPNLSSETPAPKPGVQTPALLELRSVVSDRVHGVSLTLGAGEVLGLAGMVGSGRTEILETIFGLRRVREGTLCLSGTPVTLRDSYQAIQRGIALVPEDRHLQGVALAHSIGRNIALPRLRQTSRYGIFRRSTAQKRASSVMRELSIKAPHADTLVANLSGGNQQKVVFGKWRSPDPVVLLLDEPTVGVDVGAREELYSIVRNLARNGSGVIVVSSELAELLLLCDRIAIVAAGHVTRQVVRASVESEEHLHQLVQEAQR